MTASTTDIQKLKQALLKSFELGDLIAELDPDKGLCPEALHLLQEFTLLVLKEVRDILIKPTGENYAESNTTLH
jgi:hypothetical protein